MNSFPKNAAEWKEQGNTLYKQGCFPRSIEFYNTALSLTSDSIIRSTLCTNIANAHFQMGNFDDSLKASVEGCVANSSNLKVYGVLKNLELLLEGKKFVYAWEIGRSDRDC